jgi:hypothetical protein
MGIVVTQSYPLSRSLEPYAAVVSFIDASFAVHPSMRSHSGVYITIGVGAFYSKSTAQKLNTMSSSSQRP